MAIRFLCPFGHPLVVPDHRAGKKGRCPTCQQKVLIPTDESPGPLGEDGQPLEAGPHGRLRSDPDPDAPLGFDDQTTLEQALGRPGGQPADNGAAGSDEQ